MYTSNQYEVTYVVDTVAHLFYILNMLRYQSMFRMPAALVLVAQMGIVMPDVYPIAA